MKDTYKILRFSFLLLPLLSHHLHGQTSSATTYVQKAYSAYTKADYLRALSRYKKANRADVNNRNSYYGLYNCYLALERYAQALAIAEAGLAKWSDDRELLKKALYMSAALNDEERVTTYWQQLSPPMTEEAIRHLLAAGYLAGGHYTSLQSVLQPLKADITERHLVQAWEKAIKKKQQLEWQWAFEVHDSILTYLPEHLFYDMGNVFSMHATPTYKNKHALSFQYHRLDIRTKNSYYGVLPQVASEAEVPDGYQFDVVPITNTNTGEFITNIYFPFKQIAADERQQFLAQNPGSSINEIANDDLFQNEFVLSYRYFPSYLPVFDVGVRFSQANIPLSRTNTSVFASQSFYFKRVQVDVGLFESVTLTDGDLVLYQLSPQVGYRYSSLFHTGLEGNFIFKDGEESTDTIDIDINPVQTFLAWKNEFYLPKPQFTFSFNLFWGDKIFLVDPSGRFIHNNYDPLEVAFSVGTLLNINIERSLSPWKLTPYYYFSYYQYREYQTLIHTLGASLLW